MKWLQQVDGILSSLWSWHSPVFILPLRPSTCSPLHNMWPNSGNCEHRVKHISPFGWCQPLHQCWHHNVTLKCARSHWLEFAAIMKLSAQYTSNGIRISSWGIWFFCSRVCGQYSPQSIHSIAVTSCGICDDIHHMKGSCLRKEKVKWVNVSSLVLFDEFAVWKGSELGIDAIERVRSSHALNRPRWFESQRMCYVTSFYYR